MTLSSRIAWQYKFWSAWRKGTVTCPLQQIQVCRWLEWPLLVRIRALSLNFVWSFLLESKLVGAHPLPRVWAWESLWCFLSPSLRGGQHKDPHPNLTPATLWQATFSFTKYQLPFLRNGGNKNTHEVVVGI